MLQWVKYKENYPYVIILLVGFAITTYKYNLKTALILFPITILFGIIVGLLIRWFIR